MSEHERPSAAVSSLAGSSGPAQPAEAPGGRYRRVLAMETTTSLGGLALLAGDELLACVRMQMGGSHSSRLLPQAQKVLSWSGLELQDVDLLVTGLGPGSFTGLRIGVATIKGLALASGIPIVGISSMETMVRAALGRVGLVAPALDARKGEVYSALFRLHPGGRCERLLDDTVEAPGEWGVRVAEHAAGEPVLWLGGGARLYREQLLAPGTEGSWLAGPEHDFPDPLQLALLGRLAAEAEGARELDSLEPNYLRPSEAELARKRALSP